MGILDALTGSADRRANATARGAVGNAFDQNRGTLQDAFGRANEFTGQGFGQAIDTLQGSRGDITGGGASALNEIAAGTAGAQGAFGQGRGAFDDAAGRYAPLEGLRDQYGQGRETLFDALGFGGSEGLGRAQEAFGNNLRSNFAFDQGLDAINRRNAAATGGGATGGNVDRSAQEFGNALAFSDTDSFLNRLTGLANNEIGLAGNVAQGQAGADYGRAGLFGQEAGTLANAGLNRANVQQNTAGRLADLARGISGTQIGQGQALSDLALGQGQGEIGLRQDYTSDLANSILGRGAINTRASQNGLNLGIEGAKLAASLATGIPFSAVPTGGGSPTPLPRPV